MTDVVTHAEIKRTQQQMEQLKADIAAARNEIANVKTVAAGSVIKSVQRGLISLLNDKLRVSIIISPVDGSKSELRMLGSMVKGDIGEDRLNAYIFLEGVDKVTAVRNYGIHNDELKVSFEITEYY